MHLVRSTWCPLDLRNFWCGLLCPGEWFWNERSVIVPRCMVSTLLICLSCMLHWGNMARVTLPSCVVTWMGPCMSIMVEPSFSMMLPINVRGAQTEMVFITELGFAPILLPVVAILPQTSCLPFHNCRCVCLSMWLACHFARVGGLCRSFAGST